VRRDHRGRYLQLRPLGVDLERFRASADGHAPGEWLAIPPETWAAFEGLAAAAETDPDAARRARLLLDAMVREAQHRGLVFDEDEE